MYSHLRGSGRRLRPGRLASRSSVAALSLFLLALPALAASGPQVGGAKGRQPRGEQGGGGPGAGYSAPEIEIALLSGAILVVGGAALILRDRRARRRNS